MKKLIILAVFLLLFPVVSHADCTVVVGGVAASGCTCSEGDAGPSVTVEAGVGNTDDTYYQGMTWTDASNSRTFCQVDVNFYSKVGTITTKDFYVRIWTIDTSDPFTAIVTNVATSDVVTGPSVGAGVYTTFTFSTPYTLTATVAYAITINMDGSSDASNYCKIARGTTDALANGHYAYWATDKTQYTSNSNDLTIKYYWCD